MTSPLPPGTDPVTTVTEFGKVVMGKAVEARAFEMPPAVSAPADFANALLVCRGKLDRLEELLGSVQALSGEMRRRAAELEANAQEFWDDKVTSLPRRDYETGKEREATANLASLTPLREARQWRKAADLAKDLAERIRLMHRGLDGTRSDIHRVLGYFTLERNLER